MYICIHAGVCMCVCVCVNFACCLVAFQNLADVKQSFNLWWPNCPKSWLTTWNSQHDTFLWRSEVHDLMISSLQHLMEKYPNIIRDHTMIVNMWGLITQIWYASSLVYIPDMMCRTVLLCLYSRHDMPDSSLVSIFQTWYAGQFSCVYIPDMMCQIENTKVTK